MFVDRVVIRGVIFEILVVKDLGYFVIGSLYFEAELVLWVCNLCGRIGFYVKRISGNCF